MASTELVAKTKTKATTEDVKDVEPVDTTTADALVAKSEELLDEIDELLNVDTINTLRQVLDDLDDVKPYSLADAIREGSTVTDQAIGAWVSSNTEAGETCALSAAMLAIRARGLA